MSGGQKTTTVQSGSSAPWGPTQAPLEANIKAIQDFYKSPAASADYLGSGGTNVVPFSQQSMQGMGLMENIANQAGGAMQNPLSAYSGMMQTLSPIAAGDFSRDTTFNNTLGRAQQDAANQVNLSISGAGRYGSGAHVGKLANTIGDMTNRAMLDRQQWAANGLQSFGNSMGQAYQAALMPGQTLQGIGGNFENLAANYLQEQKDKFNAPGNIARQNLAEQNALLSGVGALGGQNSSSGTVTTPGTSGTQLLGTGMSALGYGLGGK